MPSEAKSSPSFHEVRPATVPLHSFCQILWPIRAASAADNAMALASSERAHKAAKTSPILQCALLDGCEYFISMPLLCAPVGSTATHCRTRYYENLHHSFRYSFAGRAYRSARKIA